MIRIEGPTVDVRASAGWLPVALGVVVGFVLIRKVVK